jgi:hypothetical protein
MNHTRYLTLEKVSPDSDDVIEHSHFIQCERIFDLLVAAGAIFLFLALVLFLAFLFY